MRRDPTKSLKHFHPFSSIELNLLFTDGDKNHFPLIEPKCQFDCSLKFKLKFRENNWTVIFVGCYSTSFKDSKVTRFVAEKRRSSEGKGTWF